MTTYSRTQLIQIITDEAQKLGVPVDLALAVAQEESGLNAASIGDNGHSVGLFQLNDQGEGHGMTFAQREDPVANARIALTQIANVMKSNPNLTGGELAAAAQRPADRVAYAQAINDGLGKWSVGYNGSTLSATENDSATGSGGAVGSTPVDMQAFASQNNVPPAWLNDPEIGPLLQERANNQISPEQFAASLQQTKIYQSTPLSQRLALINQATDPSTLAQSIQQQALAIHNQSRQLGVTLTPAQELQLATQANANAWTPEQLQQNLAQHITSTGQATSGEAATDINSLRTLYKNYQVPVTDQTLNQQLQQVLSGAQTLTGIQSAVAQSAKQLYSYNPQLAKSIDGQNSTLSVLQPFIASAANTLGVSADTIDPSNPKWSFLLKPSTDAQGQSTGNMLSLDDLNKKIQTDPVYGYSTTANGVQAYTNMADALRNTFSGGAAVK